MSPNAGRFASFVMSEKHLMGAARYVERNPVKADLVERAEDWPWSSAARRKGVRESAGINRLGIRNLPAGRQVKESYREEPASRSGLDPYAGDGDVAGVAPACRQAGR